MNAGPWTEWEFRNSGTLTAIPELLTGGCDNGASGVNTNNTRGRMTVMGNSYSSTHYTSYDAVDNVPAGYQQTRVGQDFTSNQSVTQDDDDHF